MKTQQRVTTDNVTRFELSLDGIALTQNGQYHFSTRVVSRPFLTAANKSESIVPSRHPIPSLALSALMTRGGTQFNVSKTEHCNLYAWHG